jgi:signal transduction histidine kinase
MLAAWYRDMALLAGVTFPAALALTSLSGLALRRTRRELAAVARLKEESEQRSRAEEALRQAQKLEALGQLTGGVAHDFNNLLAVFASSVQILERNPTAQQRESILGAMRRAVTRGTGLTRHLLAFSRRHPVNPESVDLAAHLDTMRHMLASVGGARWSRRNQRRADAGSSRPSRMAAMPIAPSMPVSCASTKPPTSPGRMPAKLCVSERAMVTAGFANEVLAVNQYAAKI